MNSGKNVLLFVIITLLLYNIVNTKDIKTNIAEFEQKIDSIQKEMDSITELNKELDNKINSLHSEIELIDGDINRVQNNITTIKNNTNEKVRSIDIFGDNELELFFAEWARQHKDSIN